MCGIVGIIGEQSSENNIKKMSDMIIHRGPDGEGFFVKDNIVALGMRRLSIIDLSTGDQPIFNDDKTKMIVFNGEIYNYKELRKDLEENYNVIFHTHSDTEVILKMFEAKGKDCVLFLRGMFSFAIFDTNTNITFVARDHFGIKPLYLYKQNNKICAFGSEIKSILELPDFNKKINLNVVNSFLRYQYNPHLETFFENIYKLNAGTFLEISANGDFIETKYFTPEIKNEIDKLKNLESATKMVHDTVFGSVKAHMIADVEVGSFLSGGVDSSIVVSSAQKIINENQNNKKVKTFTIGFAEFSENNNARETSNMINTDHTEVVISQQEYFENLPKAIWHFDEPVADPSAIGLYFLSREAAKKVKVVLSGEGADEFFSGYTVYQSSLFRSFVKNILPKFLFDSMMSVVSIFVENNISFYGKKFLQRFYYGPTWYIGNASVFTEQEIKKYSKYKNEIYSVEKEYKSYADLRDSEKMQLIDINHWMVGDILQKADKMSMAHSLEVRTPFLDKDVFELASQIPENFKLKEGTTKYILRKAFENLIPVKTQSRRKLGFPIPIKEWFRNDIKVLNQIKNSDFISNILDKRFVKDLIESHLNGSQNNARKLYLLLVLDIWHNKYFKA